MEAKTVSWSSQDLKPRERLEGAARSQLWRLVSGALRMDGVGADGKPSFVRLVLPGDLLGVECQLGVGECLQLSALQPSRLVGVADVTPAHWPDLLTEALVQSYQRAREVAALRSGTTEARVRQLLMLLAGCGLDGAAESVCCTLPSLTDMALIVHAAPETVCRSLTSLRQSHFLQDMSAMPSRHTRLKNRPHRLQGEALLSPAT